ncbi:MAG TPA: histidinol-phosphate transaminase [Deltaproteobacteria bacterium]|nr:histidinol-phosphate transaminase [Deltaproteobacteria bacterium]
MKRPQANPWIAQIPPYAPGLSKEQIARQHGIAAPIKMASNENPLGPSRLALKAIDTFKDHVHLYPDAAARELRQAAAGYFHCEPENIIAGNGSDEIIDMVCRAYLAPGDKVVIPECTFSYYRIAALACGATVIRTPMDGTRIDASAIESAMTGEEHTKLIFLANPNNPTGTYLNREAIDRLIARIPASSILIIDEAYAAFARAADFASTSNLIATCPNIIVINTLSKSHGLAGLRVGFGLADRTIIDILGRVKPPFNLNLLAIKAGTAALSDTAFVQETLDLTWNGLDYLERECSRLGLACVPSQTNFILVHVGPAARRVYEELLQRGIITRYLDEPGLAEFLRISIGLPHENEALIANLENILPILR